jgi:hypothetical protein
LNGNREIEPKWFNELFIEGPFGVLIGLGLVKFSRIWFALSHQADRHTEYLFGGLEQLSRVLRIAYLRAIALVALIWLIISFT